MEFWSLRNHQKNRSRIGMYLYQDIGKELNVGTINQVEIIQSLWSGYGELVRLKFDSVSIIVKHVQLPKQSEHPKGWNTNQSHLRKIHSYEIETNWYENFSTTIDRRCRLPKSLKTFQSDNEWLMVMEDLFEVGFTNIVQDANETHLKTALTWLANFHAKHLNYKSHLLWQTGTYWHLDTRPDELEVLEDTELKKYAKQIDDELKNCKFQTLVHGDAKLANFCFNQEGHQCAAVDFQYVGHGCAMKDVIYFMSSAIKPDECFEKEAWILDVYFEALHDALNFYQKDIDVIEVEKEWRALYKIAWADFIRFLKGWSPSHYKINTYTKEITKQALKDLKMREYNV